MRKLLLFAFLLASCRRPPPLDTGGVPADTGETDTGASDTGASDTGTAAALLVEPANDRAYEPVAHDLLAGANHRVRLVMFLVQDTWPVTELVADLEAAAGSGIDVRVLLDEEGSGVQSVVDALNAAGVQASLDSPRTTTHNKLLVVDDEVLVGSHNWTGSALQYNHEDSVLVHSAAVADAYATYADALWADSDADPEVPTVQEVGVVPVARVQLVPELGDCVDSASARVDLAMYALAWYSAYPDGSVGRLLDAVEEAHERGVAVRVLLDQSPWIADNRINDAAATRLLDAGIEVRHTASSVTTHAKLLRCDDEVIVSDANWSHSGLDLYNGTSFVVTDGSVSDAYAAYFDGLWAPAAAWDR